MLPPPVCRCGFSTGDKYDAFKAMRLKKQLDAIKKKGIAYDPRKLNFLQSIEVEMGDVLDKLGIVNECCRAHITSISEFKDFYF